MKDLKETEDLNLNERGMLISREILQEEVSGVFLQRRTKDYIVLYDL